MTPVKRLLWVTQHQHRIAMPWHTSRLSPPHGTQPDSTGTRPGAHPSLAQPAKDPNYVKQTNKLSAEPLLIVCTAASGVPRFQNQNVRSGPGEYPLLYCAHAPFGRPVWIILKTDRLIWEPCMSRARAQIIVKPDGYTVLNCQTQRE